MPKLVYTFYVVFYVNIRYVLHYVVCLPSVLHYALCVPYIICFLRYVYFTLCPFYSMYAFHYVIMCVLH